jgi:cytoskeletal protein RodZ
MKWQIHRQEEEQVFSFDQQRIEKIAEIGSKLRNLRQEYGFDIDQVIAYTKIPRKLVQAMEDGNLKDLPEPVYIQGLIKSYADALGLDGNELSASFPTQKNDSLSAPKSNNIVFGQLRPSHLYLIYVGLIVCSVSSLSQVLNIATFAKNNPPEALVKSTPTKPNLDLQKVNNQINSNKTIEDSVQVGVTLKDSSWIRVEVDGKTEFEGTLPQGTQKTWKAQDHLTVRAGNAGGVLLSVNKKQAKPLGEPGKIKELTIAANPHS